MNLQKLIQTVSNFVFGNRKTLLIVFSVITVLFAVSASQLKVDAGFNKMVPLTHPYMKEYKAYENVFGGANRIAIALTQKNGDIYNKEFMEKLKAMTNEILVLEGVDKPSVRSLFTPNTRFIEVVEEGFAGGNVVHATFQGTPEDLAQVKANVQKSNEVGRTVANDFSGALVAAGLLEFIPREGGKLEKLNYFEFSKKLEEIRAKYEGPNHQVHIIGFAKAVGDIASGAKGVITFFGVAFVITAALMLWFVKDVKLTLIALVVAMMPVLWLLGTLPILGYGIDPLSILVPFLIFSIGVSHAVQMTKTWEREVVHGLSSLDAAKSSFASIFVPGTLALL
ncbi:MAG: RND family transporter, partial [Betaproteobacteria bacterium]|nr:RND family transporter [Betaproteobacteria bacterium]